jgi:hypothetical protein
MLQVTCGVIHRQGISVTFTIITCRTGYLEVGNDVNGLIYLGTFHFFDKCRNDKDNIMLLIKYGHQ